jgi:arsenite methyltransferase
VSENRQDQWATWLSERRHGGDPAALQRVLDHLTPIRDRVVNGARIAEGDTVLDVGCGDGLIAFAAAELAGASGTVIFSDISADLLRRCEERATETGFDHRCRFIRTAASDLAPVPDASVDAVTIRSVLIYEPAKARAFAEFHRVLRPGGRLSLFEPINRFAPDGPGRFLGCDIGAVHELVAKVRAVYDAIQPPDTDPMLNFDERDLLQNAEEAGFTDIRLRYEADILQESAVDWEAVLRSAGNPRIPTLAEAMGRALDQRERERLTAHLRPQVEAGTRRRRRAVAYLTALRH